MQFFLDIVLGNGLDVGSLLRCMTLQSAVLCDCKLTPLYSIHAFIIPMHCIIITGVISLKQLCLESIKRHFSALQPALENSPMKIRSLTKDYIENFSTV